MNTEQLNAIEALNNLISKSRVHFYKPIQIAEILFKERTEKTLNIKLNDLTTYRSKSKKWRDEICVKLVGRTSTSSSRFQDNLFEDNAIPPKTLSCLGDINKDKGNEGIVEAYIYRCFENKFNQMNNGLGYCFEHDKTNFILKDFIDLFWNDKGLRRSVDKIYEIIVYSLFSTLVECLNIQVSVSSNTNKTNLLKEFEDFTKMVIGIDSKNTALSLPARINRVGITNAADRGLDMWANFGMAIQIKHLSLTEDLAEDIVSSITSDRIVIVCKDAEQAVIESLLTQLGWKSKIQSIITENELIGWYEKALRGRYASETGDKILNTLQQEIQVEFPSTDQQEIDKFKQDRGYDKFTSFYSFQSYDPTNSLAAENAAKYKKK